ncbi:tripartite ATP-independent transporter DctM subunit [Palleronia aestuarii]|uniref:TRAP transporter large permease protein n=1 Tax=Palleronia aestuarii TaxID=568105 RepID=A0A2W7MUT7_9RHOB|nr:TRAP transporter large permease [Palleronia aestuarii]PZX11303.1 tripartite ATP-independent transporter DctM subunit [Palleronia aestuarii]
MATLILVGGLLGLLLLGLPVAFSLLLSSLALIVYEGKLPLLIMAQRLTNSLDSFPLLAIPLFILAAEIMNHSGATERIFRFANVAIGFVAGGLAHVNVVASILFSGMSGSAVADASGLGAIEVKAMLRQGYDRAFSGAVTAASSTIGPIIPPSVPMVIYGVISGTSISDLFLAGFVPGLLMGGAMMIYIALVAKRRNLPKATRFEGIGPLATSLLRAVPSLMLPVIILGGIWGGIFSPTEAAAVAAVYALFLGLVLHRSTRIRDIFGIFARATTATASIMLIVASAALYGWLVSTARIPQSVSNLLLGVSSDPVAVLAIICIILLIMGMFMELIAILTIAVPVFLPVALAAGIDPVHFGVVAVLTLMIGLLTPPFGLNIFILQRVSGASYGSLVRETMPFIAILVVLLIPLVIFPSISLFLLEYF